MGSHARILTLLDDRGAHAAMANAVNLYGDGKAAGPELAVVDALLLGTDRLPDFVG